jgi:hypothetical protein
MRSTSEHWLVPHSAVTLHCSYVNTAENIGLSYSLRHWSRCSATKGKYEVILSVRFTITLAKHMNSGCEQGELECSLSNLKNCGHFSFASLITISLSLGAFAKLRKATIRHVRPSTCNNSPPTGRIFMKFDI